MRFVACRSIFANHGESYFIGRLVLVHTVTRQHVALLGADVNGIFHLDAIQDLVCRVGHQTIDRSDQPLTRVEKVR